MQNQNSKDVPLNEDREHLSACHARWRERGNRKSEGKEFNEKWEFEQCMRCRYFIALSGIFVSDWGGCSNKESPFDGRIMFEHDGCDYFELIEFEDSE